MSHHNSMSVSMQQTNQTIISHYHLQLEWRWLLSQQSSGFEPDVLKRK